TDMPCLWWSVVASLLIGLVTTLQAALGEGGDSAGNSCPGRCVAHWEDCLTGVLTAVACDGSQYCCEGDDPEGPTAWRKNSTIIDNYDDEDEDDTAIKESCSAKKCRKRGGRCQPNNESCNGEIVKKGCKGTGCQCCASLYHSSSLCKEKKKQRCSGMGGRCQNWMKSCNGAVRKGSCKGQFCVCCIPCYETQKCMDRGGRCQPNWNHVCWLGEIIKDGCSGIGCVCCAPKPPTTST
ncbi:unnamed protein product, partial [Meganyctiphanes norvegica]